MCGPGPVGPETFCALSHTWSSEKMRFLAIINAVICLYLIADAYGKVEKSSKKKSSGPMELDSKIAADAAKGIKLFDSGRFQEALTVFSRLVENSNKPVYS